jgi:hypothetical protein
METVNDKNFRVEKADKYYFYQTELTKELDKVKSKFDQNDINRIVLWKLNRFAKLNNESLILLNKVNKNDKTINPKLTKQILESLLITMGIQLPIASTILHFKNPNIYQIIDQRVYRILYGKLYKNIKTKKPNEQIKLYLEYLHDLKNTCAELKIPFSRGDHILYMADKRINKKIKLL